MTCGAEPFVEFQRHLQGGLAGADDPTAPRLFHLMGNEGQVGLQARAGVSGPQRRSEE
jgi:hypothetical protein